MKKHSWAGILALSMAVLAGNCASAVAATAVLKADYQFQGTLNSSVRGAPALRSFASGNVFATDIVGGVSRKVLSFPRSNGLFLSGATSVLPGITSSTAAYSMSITFRFAEISSWRRIFDVRNGTSDTGLYNFNGRLNFYNLVTGPSASIRPNTYVHVVMTRDSARNVVGYINGVRQVAFVDKSNLAVVTTPNILRFFRDDDEVVNEQSAGAIARLRLWSGALTATEVAALERPPVAPRVTLKADYRFQNNLRSSVVGAPDLTNIAPNSFAPEAVDGRSVSVLRFAAGSGLRLTPVSGIIPTIASSDATYSIVMLFRFADISGYRRILDFSNSTSDSGLYNLSGGLTFYSRTAASTGVISVNNYAQVVLTRDIAANVTGYVNGVRRFTFVDDTDLAVAGANILRFFRDNGGENSAGAVARIRLYNGALTAAQVAGLDRLPAASAPTFASAQSVEGLSSVAASASAGTVQLRFTIALDAAAASDAASFSITINGEARGIESVSYDRAKSTVTVVPSKALQEGDEVVVRCSGLLALTGRPVADSQTATIAR